jgi:SPP1 family phage portal protein
MRLNENGELPRNYIDDLDALFANAAVNYRYYRRYVEGDNPRIMDKPIQTAPDNRVPVPFARKIVATLKGYMLKPGYITYKAEDDNYQELLKDTLDTNDEELLTSELGGDSFTSGYGYEVLRVDEDLTIRQYRILPSEGIPVYDDTLAENLIAFVHQVRITEPDNRTRDVRTIYYSDQWVEYQRTESTNWTETDRQDHPFGGVPAIVYTCNAEDLPIFGPVLLMIDEHDKIISSDYANELERFANAYLVALKKISSEVASKVKELSMFDDIGSDGDVRSVTDAIGFLTKPPRGDEIAEAADRFERLIYEMSMVINPNDSKTGGQATTGLAYRLRVLPMEWLAAEVEAYLSRGLQRRFLLIGNAFEALGRGEQWPVTIHFRRNMPIELDALAQTAGNLKGILSDKTILEIFPADIVPDKIAEAERIEMQAMSRLPEVTDGGDI